MATPAQQTLRVEFDLNENDIAYFRERLSKSRQKRGVRDDGQVVEKAEALIDEAKAANAPHFVVERIEKLKTMLGMLTDHDWDLTGEEREHVFDMLAYFADPKDLIADHIPGLGFIDDAIMIELVAMELEPEIEAYIDFCVNREELKAGSTDASSIDQSRDYLQRRMRRRRRRRAGGGSDMLVSLFQSSGG
ncbi:MAG: YkvA family protein [Pseudomonadota bacterium]